jgi:hypothetical protein
LISLLLSSAVLLSALAIGGLSVGVPLVKAGAQPAWLLFGFEVVVGVAASIGVLFGLGRFGDGPGLALACVGGTVLAASALGWLSANRQLGGHSITPLLAFRCLTAAAFGLLAGVCVLSRDARSWRLVGWGLATGLPCLIAAGAVIRPGSRRAIEAAISQAGTVGTIGVVLAVLVLAVLLCASMHLLIRAFELGRPELGEPTKSRVA